MENLEDRSLLSVAAGGEMVAADPTGFFQNLLASGATVSLATPATAVTTRSLERVFVESTAIPESASPQWVGYDIDARSLPANAVIKKIVLNHSVNHPRVSDLQVRLSSDSGTVWNIRNNSGGWVANFDEYRTDSTVFAGQPAAQFFHYQIADTVSNGYTGSLQGLVIWITYTIPTVSPDLIVSATHVGNFAQGQDGATYSLKVTNRGSGPTSGTVSLTDVLPAGLTATAFSGAGWTTDLATLTATRSDTLAAGASYPVLTLTVDVAPTAAATVFNTVSVSGYGESNINNNQATDRTTITRKPDLTVTSTHQGDFALGQTGTYTIVVANVGGAATSGLVTVQDILPAGLTATALSGAGWTTNLATLTATRSNRLAAGSSYPPLFVTVAVADDAPANVTNTVRVSGGGQLYTANDVALDLTTVIHAAPQIVDQNLSATQARDGQTITVGYRISSGEAASVLLSCAIVGPEGILMEDPAGAVWVDVAPGSAWYTRTFTINLPPNALQGTYDVTWTISHPATGEDSVTQTNALTIDPPVAVRIPVLMYHNIETFPRDFYTTSTVEFESQMRALKAYGYTAVSFQDVLAYRAGLATPPEKPILITFDDAYESLLTLVLPIISDPTIDFRVTAFINTADVRSETTAGGYPTDPLSWSQIRTLDASGRVDIESHTVNHPRLTKLDAAALAAELADSKNTIEQQVGNGKQVHFLAYPYGSYNETVAMAAWEAGYLAAAAVEDQVELTSADKFAMDRIQVDRETSVQLDQSGWYEFFFNRIEDPDIRVPNISIVGIEYLDPVTRASLDITNVQPGQSVAIRVNVRNSGSSAPVTATLAIDSDGDRTNGVVYDSHAPTANQDIQQTCPWGTSSWEWVWTVPDTASASQYFVMVEFKDPKYVLGFRSSDWAPAFHVTAMEPLTLSFAVVGSSSTAQPSLSTSISPVAPTNNDSAHDAVLAAAALPRGSTTSSTAPSSALLRILAKNLQNHAIAAKAVATESAVAHDLVLANPWALLMPM